MRVLEKLRIVKPIVRYRTEVAFKFVLAAQNEEGCDETKLAADELPYKEPPWSGPPNSSGEDYEFVVLKSGSVIGNVNLMGKSFWTFGRQESCDIQMAHPSISR